MRTLSANHTFIYDTAKDRKVLARVKIEDGDGTLQDITDFKGNNWLVSVEWGEDVDNAVADATIEVQRELYNDSLAPFHETSRLNLNAGGSYDQLLDLTREVVIEVAVIALEQTVASGDWVEVFRGQIDKISFPGETVKLSCRDQGATLQDTWIETEAAYGDASHTVAVEDAMQDILDDVLGGSAPTLYVPSSPSWNVTAFASERQSLMDQLQLLADQIGWSVRYAWDSGTSAFRLTLAEFDRSKTVADYTFAADDYYEVTQADVDLTSIRNAIAVTVETGDTDASSTAIIVNVTRTDATSITRYGRRFMAIQLAATSNIDTTAEANAVADACLADLKDPIVYQTVAMPFFHAVQLGDLYTFTANNVHFTSDQDLAVTGYRHRIDEESAETEVTVKGAAPSGSYKKWFAKFAMPGNTMARQALTGITGPTLDSSQLDATEVGGGVLFKAGGLRRGASSGGDVEYEWHVGTASGFTPDTTSSSTTYLKRAKDRTMILAADEDRFPVGETRYVKVCAIDKNGIRGTFTSAAEFTPKRYGAAFISTDTRLGAGYPYGTFSQQSRGTALPPDGWSITTGTWGTDADVDNGSTYARSKTGSKTLLLKSTATATTVRSDRKQCTPNRTHDFSCELRASSISSGRTVTITVRWLDRSGTPLSTDTLHNAVLPACDYWVPIRAQLVPPDSARFVQFAFAKAAELFDVAVDRLIFEESGAHGVEENLQTVSLRETFVKDGTASPWGDLGWTQITFTAVTVTKVPAAAAALDQWSETGVVQVQAPAANGQGGGLALVGDIARGQFYGRPPLGTVEQWKIRIPTATANFVAWAGIWSSISTWPDYALANTISGIGFVCRTASGSTRWYGVCRNGTSETTVDLEIDGADTRWRTLGWRRTASGIQFTVDDDDVGDEVTTNLPTATAVMAAFFGMVSSAADATKTLQVDDWGLRAMMVRNRRQPDDDEGTWLRTAKFGHDPAGTQVQRIRVPDGFTLSSIAVRSTVTPTAGTIAVARDVDNTTTNQLNAATYDPTALTANTEANPTLTATGADLQYEGAAWVKITVTNLNLGGATAGLDVSPIFVRTT